jgi:hypothetical protein
MGDKTLLWMAQKPIEKSGMGLSVAHESAAMCDLGGSMCTQSERILRNSTTSRTLRPHYEPQSATGSLARPGRGRFQGELGWPYVDMHVHSNLTNAASKPRAQWVSGLFRRIGEFSARLGATGEAVSCRDHVPQQHAAKCATGSLARRGPVSILPHHAGPAPLCCGMRPSRAS